MNAALEAAMRQAGLPFRAGTSWTIDTPYRETVAEARRYQAEGVLCVEMEAAALFAVAKVRGLHVASAFAISDSLADLLWNPQLHGPEVQVGVIPLYEAAVTPCRQLSGTPGHCDWCRCHGTWAGNRRVASCRAGRLQLLTRRSCAMRHRKKAYPRHSPASARCTACAPPRHERPLFAPVSLSG